MNNTVNLPAKIYHHCRTMIIPTAKFDPLFAEDGIPFRQKMVQYIRREFSDILGKRTELLLWEFEAEYASGTQTEPDDMARRRAA